MLFVYSSIIYDVIFEFILVKKYNDFTLKVRYLILALF